jgi:CIC family chloride channel protein
MGEVRILSAYQVQKIKRVASVLLAAATIGMLSALVADTLKVITEHYEHSFLTRLDSSPYLIFVLPLIGFTIIHILRHFLFKNRPNKGIKEVMDTVNKNGKSLPGYKIPSHYFNGFLTVIFGGSTGIEVSTVVSTAAIGALSSRKVRHLKRYRTDLVCSGLAAGVTALFNAPIAGFLFAFEVFTKRKSKLHTACVITAVISSYVLTKYFFYKPLFDLNVSGWQITALPYMILLAVLAGFNAVMLTRSVLFFKGFFAGLQHSSVRILAGSLVISGVVFFMPALYGEGYAGIEGLLHAPKQAGVYFLLPMVALLVFKPIATSVTLGVGGDGGVFAPSLFIGAFLGFVVAIALNHFFQLHLIPLNFMVIGMAAVLSASIHAPLTAIFLVSAIAGNYILIAPIAIAALIGKFTARFLFPYTVYTYKASEHSGR